MSKADLDALKSQIKQKRGAAGSETLGDKSVPPLPKLAIKNRRVLKVRRLATQRLAPLCTRAASSLARCDSAGPLCENLCDALGGGSAGFPQSCQRLAGMPLPSNQFFGVGARGAGAMGNGKRTGGERVG